MSSAAFPNTNDPCQEIYRGPAPESEKETKAVSDFIRSHLKSIKAYITFHSYSQMLLFPYWYTSKLPPNHKNLVCREKPAVYALVPPLPSSLLIINNLGYFEKNSHFNTKEETSEVYLRVKISL